MIYNAQWLHAFDACTVISARNIANGSNYRGVAIEITTAAGMTTQGWVQIQSYALTE